MLKKVFAVFPFFIFFAFSGLFVFASPSSPVVFKVQSQVLTAAQKQDHTWEWIKSELRNRYTYLDFDSDEDSKSLLVAAKDDTQYEKKGSELEQKVKNSLLAIFAAAKIKNKTGVLKVFFSMQFIHLRSQQNRWNSLVNAGVAEQNIDALLNPQYAYLAKTPISIKKEGEEVYKGSLEPLFLAAKRFGVISLEEFPEVKIPGFREIIWDFCFLSSVGESDINAAFTAADAKNKPKLNNLWAGIKDELKKPEYVYLVKTPILIDDENYDLKFLFDAAQSGFAGNGYDLDLAAKMQLQDLVNANIDDENFKVALTVTDAKNKPKLNNLWTGIKDELKKPEYAHLSKTPILINNKNYDLKLLFDAAQSGFTGNGYDLRLATKMQLQDLVNANIDAQKLKDALAKTALDILWSEIKSELKKPEYAHLSKTPILINNKNYDLKFLFETAHDFTGNGYNLNLAVKMQLQDLLNANIDGENFKVALTAMNNQKLDHLWNQLKKILNQPEFSKWKNTSIKIKNKSYDLSLLFAAKDKTNVKGSALPLDTKLKLQKLVNDQVTSEMIENQLLALNQAEVENNKQAKEKQQHQGLTIGLATSGSVLVAAGVGGFLYWFFKIRK